MSLLKSIKFKNKLLFCFSIFLSFSCFSFLTSCKSGSDGFTITFKDDDDTILESKKFEVGSYPTFSGGTPEKKSDAQYTYKFDSWVPKLSQVTCDMVYTASYSKTINKYLVTWKNYDNIVLEKDSVEYGKIPVYEGLTPSKPSEEEYCYVFTGWSPAVTEVKNDITYVAQFEATRDAFYVTFLNYDGTKLDEKLVKKGEIPTYTRGTPTRKSDQQYTYTFAGWDKDLEPVTQDVTYTAKYSTTINKYNITWKNYNDEILKVDSVPYGTVPVYTGTTPTREKTAQYTYSFKGWDKTPVAVTGDATYTATFNEIVNKYTITWKNYDDTVLKSESYSYGTVPVYTGTTPTREKTAQYTYEFKGWDKTPLAVTGDATYIATFNEVVNKYTVTWKNYDGDVLEIDAEVPYGNMPSYDRETPIKESTQEHEYSFSGWSPSISEVTCDVEYIAQFIESTRKYTVTWMNYNGDILKVDSVPYGTVPVYTGTTPAREKTAQYTYSFKGWDKTPIAVTGDATYIATFNEVVNKYTITWKNYNGDILETDKNVPYGEMPSYDGETPIKESTQEHEYSFSGWSPSISEVTCDVEYIAQFIESSKEYTITWENYNGDILKVDSIPYGTVPVYTGTTPIREKTAQYTYSFKGWDKTPIAVTGDATYIATFNEVVNKYTITWENYDGTVLKTESVSYGTIPVYTGVTPTRPSTSHDYFTFSGWSPEITTVYSDTTYIAQYSSDSRGGCVYSLSSDGKSYYVSSIKSGYTDFTIFSTYNNLPVISIGESAFSDCSSLSSITFEENSKLSSIGKNAFYKCSSLSSITIPNSVTSIGETAFYNCSSLSSITIPNSVTSIGDGAFYNCSSLSSITIPNSVTSIGDGAFCCSSLSSITFEENSNLTSIGQSLFMYCSSLSSITIPNSVTSIGYEAFSGCTSLSSITIPNSVTSIGADAFSYCKSLSSITFEENSNLTSIGKTAFEYCTSLSSITIPNSITSIGYRVFYYCSSLSSVTFEENSNLTSIVNNAFEGCSSLSSITIPNSITSIGYEAFSGCTSLSSITIPNSVTSIGVDAFYKCSSLSSIIVSNENTKYDSRDNCNAIIETSTNKLLIGCKNTVIPNSVTSIGDGAFYNCSSLSSITIPNSVTSIGDGAFWNCSSLSSIDLSNLDHVIHVDLYPFSGCNLSAGSIKVPSDLLGDYKNEPFWSYYADYMIGV